jgi:hypothetical protein
LDALSAMRTVVDMSQDGHGAYGSVYNGLCFVHVSLASIFEILFFLSFFLSLSPSLFSKYSAHIVCCRYTRSSIRAAKMNAVSSCSQTAFSLTG